MNAEDLVAELKALRSGRALESTDIEARVGPALRWAANVLESDGPVQLRGKVTARLQELVDGLPHDLRLATSAAFGLAAEIRFPTFQARLDSAAVMLERDPRTVKRRVDDGIARIAELLLARTRRDVPSRSGPPWRTKELTAAVVLDLPVPEVIETRRIVAEQDGLAEVELAVTFAAGNGSLDNVGLDMLYGGVVTNRVMKSTNRIGFVLRPPRSLGKGEEHEYAFRIRLTPDREIAPHYVCTPRYPCERFRLRVRFGPDRVPGSIWRLDDTLPLEVEDPNSARVLVTADDCGEVHTVFTDLDPNRSYGVAWSGAGSDARRPT